MEQRPSERSELIIKYNMAGIAMNLILGVFKIAAGLAVHAHAVMLDGVNSLSDMLSSVISIASMMMVRKGGDKAHPFGYGRLEYIGSFAITAIVIYIGGKTLIETIGSIIHPHAAPAYTTLTITVMAVSLICKTIYGILLRNKGRSLDSIALIMTGTDSLGDAMISLAIMAAIGFYRVTGMDIEHYLCIFISLTILRTGIDMIRRSVGKMLGERVEPDKRQRVAGIAAGFDEVLSVSNVTLHNYGEGTYIGSVDIEVDEGLSAKEIGRLSRRIIRQAEEEGIVITSVGICGVNTSDPEIVAMQDRVTAIALKHKAVKRVSSFTVDTEYKYISFYMVPDYEIKNREESLESFRSEVEAEFPGYDVDISVGIDA